MPVSKEDILELPSAAAEEIISKIDRTLTDNSKRDKYRDISRYCFKIPYDANDLCLSRDDQKYIINAYLNAGWDSVAFDEDEDLTNVVVLGYTPTE